MPRSEMQPGRDSTRRSASLRRDLLPQVQLELTFSVPVPTKLPGRDPALEALTRELLLRRGEPEIASRVRVEWSSRLRSAAGRAEYGRARILLNCRLCEHGEAEIDRTLRHELAHLLAQARAGRRRIAFTSARIAGVIFRGPERCGGRQLVLPAAALSTAANMTRGLNCDSLGVRREVDYLAKDGFGCLARE